MLLPERDKDRFFKVAKDNGTNHVELILSWITDYVEKHEEDEAAKKLHDAADNKTNKKVGRSNK